MGSIAERIRARATSLTESQRGIAGYVTASYDRSAFLTAAELAGRVGVSESSVVRFTQVLGYEGYAEFRRALQETVRDRLTTVDRLAGLSHDIDTGGDMVLRVMRSDVDSIHSTLGRLDRDALYRVVDGLLSARRVGVVGLRGSSGLAGILGFGLQWILRNVVVITSGDSLESMMGFGPDDLVLAISFPRHTRATVDLLEFASRRGSTTVALTDSVMSPLSAHADVLLLADSGQVSYADSLCGPLSVINVLLGAVGTQSRDRTERALEELEDIWARYEVYVDPGRNER